MKQTVLIKFILLTLLVLFLSPVYYLKASEEFVIEPITNDWSILGYANGTFDKENNTGCFNIKELKLIYNDNDKYDMSHQLIGIRLELGIPYKGQFIFISKTPIYKINEVMEKGSSIIKNDIKMCLTKKVDNPRSEYFYSMAIIIKHDNPYGYALIHSHERKSYEKLMK